MVNQVAHSNGVTYTQAAGSNGMRRPSSYTVTNGATPMWQSGAYAYDGAGNVTAIGAAAFSYDAVSRLVSGSVVTVPVGGGTPLGQGATYDPFGNLTALSTESSPNQWSTVTLQTNPSTNRLVFHPYDNSGAMTSWSGNVYHREDLGLVWRVEAAGLAYVHLYTADDERIWTFHEGQNRSRWTIRDLDNKVLREFDNHGGGWTVQRDYVHRDGALLAAVLPTGQVNHFHPDHLGTPRLITRNDGWGPYQVAFHAYYPYGVEATSFGQDDERVKFTGHERDLGVSWSAADDVDYMHARYYNAQVGRFLSVDPILLISRAQRRPQLWNRYSYVRGNPMNYIDPTGEVLIAHTARRKAEAQDELDALIGALVEVGAQEEADQLRLEAKGGEVRITNGGADWSKATNSTVALIGKAISTDQKIGIALTSDSSSKIEDNRGAYTTTLPRSNPGRAATILINPALVASSVVRGRTSEGVVVGLSFTLGTAVVHELGHAVKGVELGGIFGTNTHATAVHYENQHRLMLSKPSTIPQALRIRH